MLPLIAMWRPFRYEILDFFSTPFPYVAIAAWLVVMLFVRRMGRGTYAEYLRSPRWRELRSEAIERDKKRCRLCNRADGLQVHHRRYADHWGKETADDLTTLCDHCHMMVSHSQAQQRIYSR